MVVQLNFYYVTKGIRNARHARGEPERVIVRHPMMLAFLRDSCMNLAVLVRKSSSVVWKAEDGVFRPFFCTTRGQRQRAHAFECATGGSTCTCWAGAASGRKKIRWDPSYENMVRYVQLIHGPPYHSIHTPGTSDAPWSTHQLHIPPWSPFTFL